MDEAAFQAFADRSCRRRKPPASPSIAGDTRIAGRVQADGIHVEVSKDALAETIEHFQGKMMVGAGGAKTRDDALELGETRPDYSSSAASATTRRNRIRATCRSGSGGRT